MLKPITLAAFACLSFAAPALAANSYGGYDIAVTKGARESEYAGVKGWTVVSATVNGKLAYCAGEKLEGDRVWRVGYDNMQWQIAVPYPAKAAWEGSLSVDGDARYASGTSGNGWSIAWLGMPELDRIRQGKTMILDIGKASLAFKLDGFSATITKIEECLQRGGKAPVQETSATQEDDNSGSAADFDEPDKKSKLAVTLFKSVGPWDVTRNAKEKSGPAAYCTAIASFDGDQGLLFRFSQKQLFYGFRAQGTAEITKRTKMGLVFGRSNGERMEVPAKPYVDNEGVTWLVTRQKNEDGPGMEETFMASDLVTFDYKSQGEKMSADFPLDGTHAALQALFQCVWGK